MADASTATKNKKRKGNDGQEIRQLSDVEHVLRRPAVYMGSSMNTEEGDYIAFEKIVGEDGSLTFANPHVESGVFSRAWQKISDEVIINARDHGFRKGTGVKNIWVTLTEDGAIVVHNDGKGVKLERVEKSNGEKVWSPELAFGNLRAGDNFDDEADAERTTGGCNGVGSKLTNLFSEKFQVETRWCSKFYRQLWESQMGVVNPPTIEKAGPETMRGTRILFFPKWELFGINPRTPSVESFLIRRCIEVSATTPRVTVHYNGSKINVKNMKEYAELFVGKDAPKAHLKTDRWECVVTPKLDWMPTNHQSFVNGIPTTEGGSHLAAYNPIGSAIAKAVSTKKETVKPAFVRKNICIFVSCIVNKPQFNHQGKTRLESKRSTWGSEPDVSTKTLKKAVSAMKEHISTVLLMKDQDNLSKDSRRQRLFIPKLDDALRAGKPFKSFDDGCMLILTEGDSAKALAIAGLGALGSNGRKFHGVYPLRGKLLNARSASAGQISRNKEIMAICRIMGLVFQKKIERKKLRYSRIMIMTDQDHDGSHIKGLILNFLHSRFRYTLEWDRFVGVFHTPRRRGKRGSEVVDFYSDDDYRAWSENRDISRWKFQYYKGLGSWRNSDARAFFQDFDRHVRYFSPLTEECEKRITLAFDKDMADARKAWLSSPPPEAAGLASSMSEFVDTELVHFSHANNHRSIPCVMDGLKPSQRKIIWCCFRSNVTSDIRVAQLAGKVSEKALYHHGEASLQQSIIKMAQRYMGSNNLNLLQPSGQFGTRIANPPGSDAAAPRYIHTCLEPYTRALFPAHCVLDYVTEDGVQVEPRHFMPCLPLLLINGSSGIGTGYSTEVLPHAIQDVAARVRAMIRLGNSDDGEIQFSAALVDAAAPPLVPHWSKFKGAVTVSGHKVTAKGIASAGDDGATTIITELPPGVSTEKFVEDCAKKGAFSVKRGDTENVDLLIHTTEPLPLEKTFYTSNMHAFTADGFLMKYDTADDILQEYLRVGRKVYVRSLEKKREGLRVTAREQRRRKDYIDIFCAPSEEIVYPLREEQLSRLMVAKGWGQDVSDLLDSVKDREKTEAGARRASDAARRADEELAVWDAKSWRDMWLGDIDVCLHELEKSRRAADNDEE